MKGPEIMKHGITCQQCRSMFIRDVREIFSIAVSTLWAGPFSYRVWFRHVAEMAEAFSIWSGTREGLFPENFSYQVW